MSDEKAVAEVPSTPKKKTKARVQAEQALAMLKQGPVTFKELRTINPEYPGDPISFLRHAATCQEIATPVFRFKVDGITTYSLTPQSAQPPVADASADETAPVVEEAAGENQEEAVDEEGEGDVLEEGEDGEESAA